MNEAQGGTEAQAGAEQAPALPAPAFPTTTEVFDVESILAILRKRLHIILLAVAVSTILAAVKAFSEAPVYAASAKIQLGREPVDPRLYAQQMVVESWLSPEYVNTETMLIRGRLVAQEMLDRHPEVVAALEASQAGDKVAALTGSVFVKPVTDTYLLEVGYESETPKNCQTLANALAEVYAKHKEEERRRLTNSTSEMIAQQIPQVQQRIADAQRKLEDHARRNEIPPGAKDMLLARLKGLHDPLFRARYERMVADSEVESINIVRTAGRPIESAPPMQTSTVLQSLRTQLTSAEIELAQLEDRYKEHCRLPKVAALRARRDQLKLAIQDQVAEIEHELESQRDERYAQEKRLEKAIDDQNKQASQIEQQEQETLLLQKEIDINNQQLEKLFQRLSEIATYSPLEASA